LKAVVYTPPPNPQPVHREGEKDDVKNRFMSKVNRAFQHLIISFTVCYLLFAVSPTLAQTDAPSIIDQCAALLPPDRPMPTGADAPSIRILSPTDGEVLYGSEVLISIETENFDLNSEARHWHLWVDGQLVGMVYQPVGIIDLTPGTHLICASLGNTDHADLGMPAGIIVTVQQPAAGTPTPTLSIRREDAPVLAEPAPSPIQIVLLAGLGLLAAVGGWWLGSRLPKNRK
jgi:hypothetical protein